MRKKDRLIEDALFYCEHLNADDIKTSREVQSFYNNKLYGEGIVDYIRGNAFSDEAFGINRTYVVRDKTTDEFAAFFSLKAGMASKDGMEMEGEEKSGIDVIPGIELSYFGVNQGYMDKHPKRVHIGLLIFTDFIIPVVMEAKEYIGAAILYGFSVDDSGALLRRYLTEYGFKRLPAEYEEALHENMRPNTDKGCVFIYQQI